jgi:uncharacterized protein
MTNYPRSFSVMAKPHGPVCNLDCKYCYYLSKEKLYPNSTFRMSVNLLEEYIRQYIVAHQVPAVNFVWQGGEPTLMGLEFFEMVVRYQQKHRKPGMRIYNSLQTNAVTLDDDWCRFFKSHNFLIGVSLDGPQALHDHYRVDKGQQPTFHRVIAGIELLKSHAVEFNILTAVHAANAQHPLEVYKFLRDDVTPLVIQFIPIVEPQDNSGVSARSVSAQDYGLFLTTIFDEWVRHDVGRIYVQIFEVALAAWSGYRPGLCIFDETCGTALAMEHNGDVYSCDHFVEPRYQLGNIIDVPLSEIVMMDEQREFGLKKREALPQYCRDCDVRFVCNGGCPKNRFIEAPDGEPGLNYLCSGYKHFFTHINDAMKYMANELRHRRPPSSVMAYIAQQDSIVAKRDRDDL